MQVGGLAALPSVSLAVCICLAMSSWFHVACKHNLTSIDLLSQEHPDVVHIDRRVLVGVFSTAAHLEQRAIIRAVFRSFNVPRSSISYKFVLGRSHNQNLSEIVRVENNAYSDILLLPCSENMNNGKTYEFFVHIARHLRGRDYDFVLKLDDDAFLHPDNYLRAVQRLPAKGVYYGFADLEDEYMIGFGYTLSLDLVLFIASSPYAKHNCCNHRHEDVGVGKWLQAGESVVSYFVSDRLVFQARTLAGSCRCRCLPGF